MCYVECAITSNRPLLTRATFDIPYLLTIDLKDPDMTLERLPNGTQNKHVDYENQKPVGMVDSFGPSLDISAPSEDDTRSLLTTITPTELLHVGAWVSLGQHLGQDMENLEGKYSLLSSLLDSFTETGRSS